MAEGLETRLIEAAALLRDWSDVALERVPDGAPPSWAVRRGWDGFLIGLDETALAACESGPASAALALRDAPGDLAGLATAAARVARVPASAGEVPAAALKGASRRKSVQVAALVALCRGRGFSPARVVDVGSGAGHLTRALAKALGVEATGLERDAGRVERARAHSPDQPAARFEAVAVEPASLVLAPSDLAVGLHACGALGDALVLVAARDRAHLVLVACCPQKIEAPERAALSRCGREHGLTVARGVLGLANAFEGTPDLEARAVRVALRHLLRARGAEVRAGDESRGLTPRVRRSLPASAERALASRGLPPASEAEQRAALEAARAGLGQARRRSLPRRLIASALEVALALDRARHLEEAGARAEVVRLFPRASSPRNLAVVARFT